MTCNGDSCEINSDGYEKKPTECTGDFCTINPDEYIKKPKQPVSVDSESVLRAYANTLDEHTRDIIRKERDKLMQGLRGGPRAKLDKWLNKMEGIDYDAYGTRTREAG